VIEFLEHLTFDIFNSSSLVWSIAFILSVVTGVILHNYLENFLHSALITCAMFASILVGTAASARFGILYLADADANVVAAGGVSICAVTIMSIIFMHVFNALGDFRQKRRYVREAQLHSGDTYSI